MKLCACARPMGIRARRCYLCKRALMTEIQRARCEAERARSQRRRQTWRPESVEHVERLFALVAQQTPRRRWTASLEERP